MKPTALLNRRITLLIGALLLFTRHEAAAQFAQIEPGYFASIERVAADTFEAHLIARAEATYPERDSVVAAAASKWRGLRERLPDGPLWWYADFDRVRIPYAITAEAVAYYTHLIDSFRVATPPPFIKRAEFKYRASVSYERLLVLGGQRFDDVYLVQMHLTWSQQCGDMCAMWIELTREVVLDREGRVRLVRGDGRPRVAVS